MICMWMKTTTATKICGYERAILYYTPCVRKNENSTLATCLCQSCFQHKGGKKNGKKKKTR